MDKLALIADALNQLVAKQMVLSLGLEEALRALPEGARTAVAARMRQRAAEALQMHSEGFSPSMDEAATLQLAALLEAAGQPPKT